MAASRPTMSVGPAREGQKWDEGCCSESRGRWGGRRSNNVVRPRNPTQGAFRTERNEGACRPSDRRLRDGVVFFASGDGVGEAYW